MHGRSTGEGGDGAFTRWTFIGSYVHARMVQCVLGSCNCHGSQHCRLFAVRTLRLCHGNSRKAHAISHVMSATHKPGRTFVLHG